MSYLIVPIFSMRSYETGKFAVLKDGNFQLHLHRAPSNSIICVPKNSSDLDQLYKFFPQFRFLEIEYQDNAVSIREEFWKKNSFLIDVKMAQHGCTTLVTDIQSYAGLNDVIYNFNISYDPDLDRPYIDKFRSELVTSANLSKRTFVLNECQKTQLVDDGVDPSKIIVSQAVINKSIMDQYSKLVEECEYSALYLKQFHPFRISDPCYDFDSVVNNAKDLLYITDPNDSFSRTAHRSNCKIIVIKPSKIEYYKILSTKPVIEYNENPQKVFHPGLAEFIYFGCQIKSAHKIPEYNDIIVNSSDFWSGT